MPYLELMRPLGHPYKKLNIPKSKKGGRWGSLGVRQAMKYRACLEFKVKALVESCNLCKIMYTICFMYYGHLFGVAQILLSKPVDWIKGMTNLPERMKTSIEVLFQLNNNSRCTIHTVQNYTHFKSYLLEKLQMVSPWTLCQ